MKLARPGLRPPSAAAACPQAARRGKGPCARMSGSAIGQQAPRPRGLYAQRHTALCSLSQFWQRTLTEAWPDPSGTCGAP